MIMFLIMILFHYIGNGQDYLEDVQAYTHLRPFWYMPSSKIRPILFKHVACIACRMYIIRHE